MNNIYDTPQSRLQTPLVEEQEQLRKLLKQQRIVLGPMVAFFGTIFLLVIMSFARGVIPVFVFLVPAMIMGAALKYFARFVTTAPRVISSIIVAFVTLGFLLLVGFSSTSIFISFIAFLACVGLNRRPLTMDQERLLYRWKLGKLSI